MKTPELSHYLIQNEIIKVKFQVIFNKECNDDLGIDLASHLQGYFEINSIGGFD